MFYLFVIACVLFLLRRRIDSFAVAAIGIAVYYFPIYFDQLFYMDSAANFVGAGKSANLDLQIGVLIVFYSLLLCSFLPPAFPVIKKLYGVNEKTTIALLSVATFFLSLYIVPIAISYSNKSDRITSIGIASVFFGYMFALSTLALLYWSVSARSKLSRVLSLFAALYFSAIAIFVFQARSVIIFSLLAFFLYFIYGRKVNVTSLRLRYVVFLGMVVFVLMGKHLANYFFYGAEYEDWALVLKDSLESYGISSNLNYVYDSGLNYFYLDNIVRSLIPLVSVPDSSYFDYHEIIKREVFPDAIYGMGRNPIGELWINLRWYGIAIYCLILCIKCSVFNFLILRTTGLLKIFLVLLLFISVFFFNRNSLQNDVVYHRNYLVFFFWFVFLASMLSGGHMFKSYLSSRQV